MAHLLDLVPDEASGEKEAGSGLPLGAVYHHVASSDR